MTAGGRLTSSDGRVSVIMQSDGNLVVYYGGRALWASNTGRHPGTWLVNQGDGNLVLYGADRRALWNTGTGGDGRSLLAMQGDGNLVLYASGGRATWATYSSTLALGARAVNLARAQIGKPYVYGAAGPNSFDCSGLTSYVWGRLGYSIPHQSQSQYNVLQKISSSVAQPGDIVVFGAPSGVYHVGIYAGSGQMIDAPHTGSYVQQRAIFGAAAFVRVY